VAGAGDAATAAARVTVVIPCYNHANYLADCLESLVAQTLPHWEAIVVDDCSPDQSEIERVIAGFADGRIRCLRHERNRGLGASRNTGIRASRTEYVYPLDADDKVDPTCLEKLVAALDADEGLDCAFADCQLFGRSTEILEFPGPPPGKKMLRSEHTIPGAGTMMRKSFWEGLGGYDEAEVLRNGREDFEFYIRAFERGCSFRRVAEPLYLYRIAHTQMSVECKAKDDEIADYIYRKHKALFDGEHETTRFLCTWYEKAAHASHLRGERRRAFQLARKCWRLAPSRRRLKMMGRALLTPAWNRTLDRGEVRARIPFVGYPLRSAARYRPFFVIGAGRSGNTLLRRLLTAHSGVHIPPETFVLGDCIDKWKRHGKHLNWPDLVRLILAQFEFHPEFETFEIKLEPLVNRLAHVPRRDRNLAFVLDAFYRYHGEAHGIRVARWGDKTPLNALDESRLNGDASRLGVGVPRTLEKLLDVFPDAQFVHIVRDGCDVVYSSMRGGFFGTVQAAAERWLHMVRQCKNFVDRHPDRSMELRYEALISDPEETLRRVASFLGIEFEPAALRSEGRAASLGDVPAWSWHESVAKPIDPKNAGKGRRLFDEHDKDLLERLIGAELRGLGYPAVTE